jgi:hypothetical protein
LRNSGQKPTPLLFWIMSGSCRTRACQAGSFVRRTKSCWRAGSRRRSGRRPAASPWAARLRTGRGLRRRAVSARRRTRKLRSPWSGVRRVPQHPLAWVRMRHGGGNAERIGALPKHPGRPALRCRGLPRRPRPHHFMPWILLNLTHTTKPPRLGEAIRAAAGAPHARY